VVDVFSDIQAEYLQKSSSFVSTGFSPLLSGALAKLPGFGALNVTPTMQEAVDLVMMEKLERELLDPDE
jgi:hypothetical protein